ncbi:GDSL-type esterase/lipase family protein [Marinicellulosiphila megalodicopiae]|uniref:GDSL-type esterase/lipase family protein n=1 Tax=Marinicellulosiphila megalodicopiae TaxID=2724896 RepID=UPI003BB1E9AB
MHKLVLICLLFLAVGLVGCDMNAKEEFDSSAGASTRAQPAKAYWAEKWWIPRHEQKIKDSQNKNYDVVIFGDSIVHKFETDGLKSWQALNQNYSILNLGFSGDMTEHVLWRIQNGELKYVSPSKVILMVGTNNTGLRFDSAQDTLLGIQLIVKEIQAIIPETNIIIIGLLPRSRKPSHKFRVRNQEVNRLLHSWIKSNSMLSYENIETEFLDNQGVISKEIMPDALHLSEFGYEILSQSLQLILEGE